ncbi:hypothetical protein RIF29_16630 [Crotalaria pallida]|uniref:Uncharacterized protein n=1 Tax=Crotalaria pallida TaxID=3830 RepID=A0AAN9FHQ0_CROPI
MDGEEDEKRKRSRNPDERLDTLDKDNGTCIKELSSIGQLVMPVSRAVHDEKPIQNVDESNVGDILSDMTLLDNAVLTEKGLKKLTPGRTTLQRTENSFVTHTPLSNITNIIACSRERMKHLFCNDDDDNLRSSSISMFAMEGNEENMIFSCDGMRVRLEGSSISCNGETTTFHDVDRMTNIFQQPQGES